MSRREAAAHHQREVLERVLRSPGDVKSPRVIVTPPTPADGAFSGSEPLHLRTISPVDNGVILTIRIERAMTDANTIKGSTRS
jgi:hypothetical protein